MSLYVIARNKMLLYVIRNKNIELMEKKKEKINEMVLLYTITCCYALLHTVTRFSKEDSLKFEKEIEIEE